MFIKPMLASGMRDDMQIVPGEWAAEEKFDGHRLCIDVAANGGNLFDDPSVRAYSRNGIPRILPSQMQQVLEGFPSGIYDGEITVPGKRSFDVSATLNHEDQVLVIFDAVELLGKSIVKESYDIRRQLLMQIFEAKKNPKVVLAESYCVNDFSEVKKLRDIIWSRNGEGLILKKRSSIYEPDRRGKTWVKIKDLKSEVLTLVGYQRGKMGPRSVMVLQDKEGNITTVKWKNLEMLRDVEKNFDRYIGRQVRIEFQERTSDGSYRHPRWDRWEDE